MLKKFIFLSLYVLILPLRSYCEDNSSQGSGGSPTNTTSRWHEFGGQGIYDGSTFVTGAAVTGKFDELIAASTPTAPPANHYRELYSTSAAITCGEDSAGTVRCKGNQDILTGLSSTLGTVKATDSILQAFNKIVNARVVQIVGATSSSNATTISASYVNTGNSSVTITPQLSTNKVLIIVNSVLVADTGGNVSFSTIARGGTNLGAASGMCDVFSNTAGQINAPCTMVFLDSPNTTSATTYTSQFKSDGVHTAEFGNGGTVSTIAIEIGQ